MSMDNFVNYLESFQKKENIDYSDFNQIITTVNAHYYLNNYQRYFHHKPYKYKYPLPLHFSAENNQLLTSNVIKPVVRQKQTIDFSIESLQDLINLIDKYPYNVEIEYNIDLQNLHKIRGELVEFNNMVGLSKLKTSVLNQLIYFIQEPVLCDKMKGFKHTVLAGPPGTGKTEIARILGTMYSKLGILSEKNIFKKVTRSDLIAGFLGQTAIKTKDLIDSCLGGCLFIDEAYSLGSVQNNDSFAKECIDTLCEALSNHKENLMVIIAGYENELNDCFFSMNPGLVSRFIWKFTIDKYSPSELQHIFHKKIKDIKWQIDISITTKELDQWFEKNVEYFPHYGRDIEQLISHIKVLHARRIYGKPIELCKIITIEDMNRGLQDYKDNSKQKNKLNEGMFGLYV